MTSSQSPEHAVQSPRINRPRTRTQMAPKIDYRGITLKQYFRLYDESVQYTTIQEIKQEQPQSGISSLAETPTFGNNVKRQNNRLKVKTELNEQQYDHYHKNQCENNKNINVSFDPNRKQIKHLKKNQNFPSTDKLNSSLLKKVYCAKKIQVKKSKKSNLTTLPKEDQSRSTLQNFYKQTSSSQNPTTHSLNIAGQGENANKMLKKLKAQKQRNNQIKIQDIFYITKYASKFHINAKDLLT